jgi:hypothetical protein
MMLTDDEEQAVRDRVSEFTVAIVDAALELNQENMTMILEDFAAFICQALVVARRDGRRQVLELTNN